MNTKLSLSKLSQDAICKEAQSEVKGAAANANCWNAWVAKGKTGGYANEQYLNSNNGYDVNAAMTNIINGWY
ncbi:MAG: hypothetical protein WCM76_11480 [Bacteroidota bacterium]